ncbi:phage tail sheath family protein [Levilactobacillus wangkuiensis]|uniref:phage tail sheath family protein n=1 Tax=Levilactobacillus wangkuiensis TaxID=2799566 RepID=UPI001942E709|nr:phage tail sheath family protein [Levilactobacillus wangkuiensis]
MAGGTWTTQNKRRPGAYINTKGVAQAKPDTTLGRTLLINSEKLNWGANGVTEVDAGTDFKAVLGTTLDKLVTLKETLKGALTVLFLNTNSGEKATVAPEALPWAFTAKYAGTKGNDLTISVEKDPADTTLVTITTLFGTEVVNEQSLRTTNAAGLEANAYVDVAFTAEGAAEKLDALSATTTYPLVGGTTKPTDVTDVLNDVMGTENYNVVTTAGFAVDNDIHGLVAAATKRLREDEGYKIRAVVPGQEGGTKYDYEGVSVVNNGVELTDGTVLTTTQAAGWFAGASSAADEATSLTYTAYPDAVAASPKRTNEQTITALNAGQVVFTTRRDGTVVVEQDINSLLTVTDDKPKSFQKNRTMRTLDTIAMNTSESFEDSFIGKVGNDATGRGLFKADRATYLQGLADARVIQAFDPEDITVDPGTDADAIVVTLGITPIDSMEKLYMTINVG